MASAARHHPETAEGVALSLEALSGTARHNFVEISSDPLLIESSAAYGKSRIVTLATVEAGSYDSLAHSSATVDITTSLQTTEDMTRELNPPGDGATQPEVETITEGECRCTSDNVFLY